MHIFIGYSMIFQDTKSENTAAMTLAESLGLQQEHRVHLPGAASCESTVLMGSLCLPPFRDNSILNSAKETSKGRQGWGGLGLGLVCQAPCKI